MKITGSFSKVIFPAPPPMICAFSQTASNRFYKKLVILGLNPSSNTINDFLLSKKIRFLSKLFKSSTNKKSEFFGAVQIKNSYVAFRLMPVYYYPHLLDNISQDLKDRMQGKSCFNFKEIDDKLFKELTTLTKKSFDLYKSIQKI